MRIKTLLKLALFSYGIFNALKSKASISTQIPLSIKDTYIKKQNEHDMNYNIGYSNTWQIPEKGIKFAGYFDAAEWRYGLPQGLLSRMAYQESHFRDDIISGEIVSSAGAIGLMQIIPKWHPTVDPLNPADSIYYAGQYIRKLYDRFGSWEKALAAYNWGPTNLAKKGLENAPSETQRYILDIRKDIGIA